jgi:hypothetical protein
VSTEALTTGSPGLQRQRTLRQCTELPFIATEWSINSRTRLRMLTTRTVLLVTAAVSLAWVATGSLYFMADLKADFAVQRHLARIEQAHAFVIPIDCAHARGLETREFRRDQADVDRCWVDIRNFRRLYPEVAAATDVAATVHFNVPSELPIEEQGGTPIEVFTKAAAVVIGGPVLTILVALSCVS